MYIMYSFTIIRSFDNLVKIPMLYLPLDSLIPDQNIKNCPHFFTSWGYHILVLRWQFWQLIHFKLRPNLYVHWKQWTACELNVRCFLCHHKTREGGLCKGIRATFLYARLYNSFGCYLLSRIYYWARFLWSCQSENIAEQMYMLSNIWMRTCHKQYTSLHYVTIILVGTLLC